MENSTVLLNRALQPGEYFRFGHSQPRISLELCEDLIKKGADLDVIEQRGTPCIPYVYWDVEMIQFFLDHRRDVNARDELGNTALIYAASGKRGDVVEFLLDNFADPNVRNLDGETALYKLVTKYWKSTEATSVAKTLIERGADVNLRTAQGLTLLHDEHFNHKIFECVLDKFENVDIRASKSKYENTPLMVAAIGGNLELCRVLIERNADVNAQNSNGFTSLHFAVFSKISKCVKLLLSSGSDPNIKSFSGLDAFDMHRFIPSITGDESILDCFEDSKLIDVFEMSGAEWILRGKTSDGCILWKRAFELRRKLNLPKPEPTLKQKALYKILDHVRMEQELKDLVRNEEAMYRQALLTVDSISNGSNWFLLRTSVFLLSSSIGREEIKFRLVTEILRHISEDTQHPENVDIADEFKVKILSYLIDHFLRLFCRTSDHVVNLLSTCIPYVYAILYHVLRKKCDRDQVPVITTNGLNSVLNLVHFVQIHPNLEPILRSHTEDFFTKMTNLRGLRDVNGDTLLHLACAGSTKYSYCANMLVDGGANVKELNRKNQEPIQLIQGNKDKDCKLVLKMVERGAHLDAKSTQDPKQSALEELKRRGISTVPYVPLKCLAASVLARSFIHYKRVLPPMMTEFVNQHLID